MTSLTERIMRGKVQKKEFCCDFYSICPDIHLLNLSYEEGIPSEDLLDQFEELCTHSANEARESSCGKYKSFNDVRKILLKDGRSLEKYYSLRKEEVEKINQGMETK